MRKFLLLIIVVTLSTCFVQAQTSQWISESANTCYDTKDQSLSAMSTRISAIAAAHTGCTIEFNLSTYDNTCGPSCDTCPPGFFWKIRYRVVCSQLNDKKAEAAKELLARSKDD